MFGVTKLKDTKRVRLDMSRQFQHDWPPPREILIILMGALGDVARGMALPAALKRKFPDTKLTWLVEPGCEALVRLNTAVDRVIVFERKKGLRALSNLKRELEDCDFDLTLDLQRHLKSGIFSFLSGAKTRLGFARKNSKEFNWLFNNRFIEPQSETFSKFEHYHKFLELLGVAVEPLDFALSRESLRKSLPEKVAKISQAYLFVVLGSSWKSKDWTPAGYSELLEKIFRANNLAVVLLGDSSQGELGEQLEQAFSNPKLINLAGRTELQQAIAVIAAATAGVGPDSGPGHISALFGVPYISLFGPTDERRVAPFGMESYVVRSQIGCAPCCRRVCPGLNRLCMRMISAEQVWSRIENALHASATRENWLL